MVAPLSGTPEAGWRASSPVGLLSETCEAEWRASSLVGSGYGGCEPATNSTPSTARRGGRRLPPVAMSLCRRPRPAEEQAALDWSG